MTNSLLLLQLNADYKVKTDALKPTRVSSNLYIFMF